MSVMVYQIQSPPDRLFVQRFLQADEKRTSMIYIIVPFRKDSPGNQQHEKCFYVMVLMHAVLYLWRVWVRCARHIRQSKSCLKAADAYYLFHKERNPVQLNRR